MDMLAKIAKPLALKDKRRVKKTEAASQTSKRSCQESQEQIYQDEDKLFCAEVEVAVAQSV
jgi:hypothetical protein